MTSRRWNEVVGADLIKDLDALFDLLLGLRPIACHSVGDGLPVQDVAYALAQLLRLVELHSFLEAVLAALHIFMHESMLAAFDSGMRQFNLDAQ